ncbi:MAG TPA: crosslink repair DNA glycosylase YcaQ family protein [Candidatus Angelobacter sp.]|nr:crosslink repair DNA glycosylase YcaQ family protein [Candidatus Angelobacter sp.]
MNPIKVSRETVRRYLLDRQGLVVSASSKSNKRSTIDKVENVIKELECVQLDPVSVVEKNQHLVLATRVPGYQPEQLNTLLADGKVFEYWANAMCVIPIEDYPIFRPIREHRYKHVEKGLDAMKDVVRGIMDRLESEGPLPSRAFKSESKVHGYWDNQAPKTKETSYALNLLLDAGITRVTQRVGNERFFGLTDLTLPKDLLDQAHTIDIGTAQKALIDKYLRAYRVVDPRDSRFGWQKMTARERQSVVERRVKDGILVPLEVTDVNRQYYILTEDIDRLHEIAQNESPRDSKGPIRFLPPLDNLLWSRERIEAFFDFDYKWEIYTPQSKRRYGPYAMPILFGDQLIGRFDPILDRKENKLIVRLLHYEPKTKITVSLNKNLQKALSSFAHFHNVQDVEIQKNEPEGSTSILSK